MFIINFIFFLPAAIISSFKSNFSENISHSTFGKYYFNEILLLLFLNSPNLKVYLIFFDKIKNQVKNLVFFFFFKKKKLKFFLYS